MAKILTVSPSIKATLVCNHFLHSNVSIIRQSQCKEKLDAGHSCGLQVKQKVLQVILMGE